MAFALSAEHGLDAAAMEILCLNFCTRATLLVANADASKLLTLIMQHLQQALDERNEAAALLHCKGP